LECGSTVLHPIVARALEHRTQDYRTSSGSSLAQIALLSHKLQGLRHEARLVLGYGYTCALLIESMAVLHGQKVYLSRGVTNDDEVYSRVLTLLPSWGPIARMNCGARPWRSLCSHFSSLPPFLVLHASHCNPLPLGRVIPSRHVVRPLLACHNAALPHSRSSVCTTPALVRHTMNSSLREGRISSLTLHTGCLLLAR